MNLRLYKGFLDRTGEKGSNNKHKNTRFLAQLAHLQLSRAFPILRLHGINHISSNIIATTNVKKCLVYSEKRAMKQKGWYYRLWSCVNRKGAKN